jgi:trimeric autotransporter adhesin
MPKGLSRAEEAAVYAGEAQDYAESTAAIAKNAAGLALEVEAEAAFSGFSGKTPKQVATALTNANAGAAVAAAAAKAAKVAAFDAGADAASAAAAEAAGDDAQADADAAAARGACAVAMASQTTAYGGWLTVLIALRSLRNPDA